MNHTLYQFGLVQWQIWPFNVQEITHTTMTDWARKEIAGAPIFREWVGEGDEEITMRGRVFPRFADLQSRTAIPSKPIGNNGMGHLDILDEHRRYGKANILMRGDGLKLGWFVIERLSRGHQFLDVRGIGQQIDFEATFIRVPVPDAEDFYRNTTMFVS